MARFESGDADGGLVVPGIYRELLERERQVCNEVDPRRALVDRDPTGRCFTGRGGCLMRWRPVWTS